MIWDNVLYCCCCRRHHCCSWLCICLCVRVIVMWQIFILCSIFCCIKIALTYECMAIERNSNGNGTGTGKRTKWCIGSQQIRRQKKHAKFEPYHIWICARSLRVCLFNKCSAIEMNAECSIQNAKRRQLAIIHSFSPLRSILRSHTSHASSFTLLLHCFIASMHDQHH